jgi:proline iminopeptidase
MSTSTTRRTLVLALALAALAGCLDDRDLVPPTVDEDPTLPFRDVDGTRLHVTEMGTPGAPLVVFIHGGPGGDHRSYLEYAGLAAKYHLVMYDQRGAGLSRREGKATLTTDYSIADLDALIKATRQGDEPVVLFTHSWGGTLATGYINLDPSRVQGLIIAETPGFTRKEFEKFAQASLEAVSVDEGIDDLLWSSPFLSPEEHARWDYLSLAQNASAGTIGGLDPVHREPVWRWGSALSYWLPQQIGEFDWTTRLSEVTFPVLWFHGDLGKVITEATQLELAKHYPRVEMHAVVGAGHDLLYQKRGEIEPIVEEYLARVTRVVK